MLLEDDQNDAELIQMYLKRYGINFKLKQVSCKEEFAQAIADDRYDVILSDHQLPQFSSLEALQLCNQKNIQTPFILVTGTVSEEFAVTILREGASDYILKDRLQRLPIAISQAIEKQKINTEKLNAELELKRTNERFELAMQSTDDVIWDWNMENDSTYLSDAYFKIYGYSCENVKRIESWASHIHPEDKEKVLTSFDAYLKSNEKYWSSHYRYLKADGSIAYVKDTAIVLRDEHGNILRATGTMQNITEVYQLQNQLLEQKVFRQKEMAETAVEAQEKERNEIGRELHDNITQLLATAKLMLETATKIPEMQEIGLKKAFEVVQKALTEVRTISQSMVPPSFSNLVFEEVLKELIDNINLSGHVYLTLEIEDHELLENLKDKVKLTLYRIIQEQSNNILKYAKADHAIIKFSNTLEHLILTISDDGVGFNTQEKAKGIGLRNMANRTELFEGTVTVESAPGKGTVITVSIPLDNCC